MLAAHIRAMNNAMMGFFRNLDDPQTAERLVRASVEDYLTAHPAI